MAHPDKAKITQKHIRRTVIWVVALAIIGYGFVWLLGHNRDPDPFLPGFHSVGDIAVIESKGSGSQAEIITADGNIIAAPDYAEGATDREIVWRPDGNRLFFESDRYNQEPHIFRWNPDRQTVERRTLDKRPKGKLRFTAPGLAKPSATALMTAGGTVVEINPNTGDTKQLLPPAKRAGNAASEGEGQQSQMAQTYAQLGNSFMTALWGNDKKIIAAVLRRDNGGQAFLLQDMTNPAAKPRLVALGEHIGIAAMANGGFVFAVVGYQLPEWDTELLQKNMKNGKVVPPFQHMLGMIDPDGKTVIIGQIPNDGPAANLVYGDPIVSPDNTQIAMALRQGNTATSQPLGVILIPLVAQGWQHGTPIAKGDFSQLSWNPSSDRLAAIMTRKDGGHDVVTIGKQHDIQNLTKGKGDFTEAVYSPQIQ